MATTCKLIAKTTLGSSATNIEFTSIPGTYTDLLLLLSLRTDRALTTDAAIIQFNGVTTGYSWREVYGLDTGAYSQSSTSNLRVGYTCVAEDTANTFASGEVYIPNYAGSTNKSISATGVQESNRSGVYMSALAGLWSNTAAISSLKLLPLVGTNFVTGSSAFLYGITKA